MSEKIFPSLKDSLRVKKVINLAMAYNCSAKSYLDVGCGDGSIAMDMGNTLNSKEVIGVDICHESLESAIENRRLTRTLCLDISKEKLPLPDGSVDFVYAGEVIEHLMDPDNLLDEIYRVLRQEGVAIIDTPNLASWFNRLVLLLGYQPFLTEVSTRHNIGKLKSFGESKGEHVRIFTKRAFEILLKIHNFEILKLGGIPGADPIYTKLPQGVKLIDNIFSYLPSLAGAIVAVVKK